VARVIVEQCICRFGVPLSLLTDNAKKLDGDLMAEICRLLRIEKLRTTMYKPSANAAVERFHRTLNGIIAKLIDSEKDWDLMLPFVMAAYRSSSHESTEFTPIFLCQVERYIVQLILCMVCQRRSRLLPTLRTVKKCSAGFSMLIHLFESICEKQRNAQKITMICPLERSSMMLVTWCYTTICKNVLAGRISG